MFYEQQPTNQKESYKQMLGYIGQLSRLFGDSNCPYLPYRIHENCFCKYFEAENLARGDISADAKKDGIGIGLKTWMGTDDQKVAEFGRERPHYANLPDEEKIRYIANLRNERIRITMNLHALHEMVYHIVKRIPGMMEIAEYAFDYININQLQIIDVSDNNIYFTDGNHTYHFSNSKNTLYMRFTGLTPIDEFPVNILDDPYDFIMRAFSGGMAQAPLPAPGPQLPPADENHLCLRLYSKSGDRRFIPEKSGLNQWNAAGRVRDPDEIYIPYPAEDRRRINDFFPPRDTCFNLRLPNNTIISAKVCQQDSKAIMSNPNKVLGHWLLRDVFELANGTLVTYEMLELFGIDSVIFTKNGDRDYSIDFSQLGTYERFYNIDIEE